jgi:hypothetical protein
VQGVVKPGIKEGIDGSFEAVVGSEAKALLFAQPSSTEIFANAAARLSHPTDDENQPAKRQKGFAGQAEEAVFHFPQPELKSL